MINIYDITGKKIQELRGSSLETYRFGDMYTAGTYLVEVIQGTNRVTQKLSSGAGASLPQQGHAAVRRR